MELKPITGVLVNYYFVCKRKLWLFANYLNMEYTSDAVLMGKLIDEITFKREKKHILIDNIINIDFMGIKGYIHETKKSDKMEDADLWQVKYYLYYLKQKGMNNFKAILHYPKLKKREIIELTETDEENMKIILDDIEKIITQPKPPPVNKTKICKKCSYYELCFV